MQSVFRRRSFDDGQVVGRPWSSFRRPAAACALLVLYLLVSVHSLRLVDPSAADALVDEDGVFETLGAVCLLLGAGAAFMALLCLRGNPGASRLKRLAYAALAVILFVAAGEEISWGQRVFGIETPAAVREINAQGETNLHNLYGDEHGQNMSVVVFQAFWVSFGVLVPCAALLPRVGPLVRRHLPVLPLWLAVLFVGQQLLWQPVRAEWRSDPAAWGATYRAPIGGEPFRVTTAAEADRHGVSLPAGIGEIMEANLQLLLAAGALWLFLDARRRAHTAPATVRVAPRVARSLPSPGHARRGLQRPGRASDPLLERG